MQFEGEGTEDEPLTYEGGNPWYFFVPPAMVGVWLVVEAARVVVWVMLPAAVARPAESGVVGIAIEGVELIGWMGWVLLFVFYFVLLPRKRMSRWWAVGGFCCGLNLPLYAALLLLPSRRHPVVAPPDFPEAEGFGSQSRARAADPVLKDSFVCDGCGSLLNYGVSECGDCGVRYTYSDGIVWLDDSVRRRR